MWKTTWVLFKFGIIQKAPGILGTTVYFALLGVLSGLVFFTETYWAKLISNLIFIVALHDLGTLVAFIGKEKTAASYSSSDPIGVHHSLHVRLPISNATLYFNRIIHLVVNLLLMGLVFFTTFTALAQKQGLLIDFRQLTIFYLAWLSYAWLVNVYAQIKPDPYFSPSKRSHFLSFVCFFSLAILASLVFPINIAAWILQLSLVSSKLIFIWSLATILLGVGICTFRLRSL